ncbi:hypothetical protein Pmani_029985 [Petrolisthes manimaculis]|uniref:Deoxyribodipyrimidine photo-lyase n=1 Tax=Petrolisthes manimaculis TaxID=1843537 RepID=A0AAE1NWI3_9EUCA|nr:hypothetical protein Pmani_029985 [Petrolisthes manimaculis]
MPSSDEEPEPKKAKQSESDLDIHTRLPRERKEMAEIVTKFKFNKKRVQMLSKVDEVPDCDGVVYWMSRDQRVQDNWALLFAQRLALKYEVSLHVVFCLVPSFLGATYRHYHFMLKGLEEVEEECRKLNIEFHLLLGKAKDSLPKLMEEHHIGGVVTDFSPLRVPKQWRQDVLEVIPKNIPMCMVDAHNVVPCWVASDKQEYSAKTIRRKITDKLPDFLTKFPTVARHPHTSKYKAKPVDWEVTEKSIEVDRTVGPVEWANPGTHSGLDNLNEFCLNRLRKYADQRNNPNVKALSNMSPWLHFGQVSAQRCVLEVKRYKKKLRDGVEGFVEEAVVRRELADNYCHYQPKYDQMEGAYKWAFDTLDNHRDDKRPYLYSREQLTQAQTHDDLWNSAQLELVTTAKMHGFMRMYWAKKVLEWTRTPEEALQTAIYLNDRFSLDGRDPNGYVGCMWSICGIHDQGWAERSVFGKIRYMNYDGCKRKFKIDGYISRFGGKKHKYIPPPTTD